MGIFFISGRLLRTPFQIEAEFSCSIFYAVAPRYKSEYILSLLHPILVDFHKDGDRSPLFSKYGKMIHIPSCHTECPEWKRIA